MKTKRYVVCLAGLVLMMIVSTRYLSFIPNKAKDSFIHKNESAKNEHLMVPAVMVEEKERFLEFAKQTLDRYFEEELAIIDPTIRSIQTDGLHKYFVTLDSIGIDNKHHIDVYRYYMIIHKGAQNELYMMPFGIEVAKGEIDKVKQDLLVSMLKSVNGWGLQYDEVWKRWQDAMVNMNYKNNESTNEQRHNAETMFYVQSLICFINEYITNRPDEAFMQISKTGLYQEILDFEIKSITDVNNHKEAYAVIEGKVRVYEKERIYDYQVEMTYTLISNPDRTFTITHQKGQVK